MKKTLDVTDIAILKLVQQDSSLTNQQIAHLIFKSPATTSARLKRLREDGYIVKMVAVLDPKLLGNNVVGYLNFNLTDVSDKAIASFKEELILIEGICECYKTVGRYDILIKVITKNLASFDEIEARISNLKCITNRSGQCVKSTVIADKGFEFNLGN